jgi:hypothetical protein
MTALYMNPCDMQFQIHSYDYIHKAFARSVKRLYTYFKPYITVSYLYLCETLGPLLHIIVGYSSMNSIVVFFFFRLEYSYVFCLIQKCVGILLQCVVCNTCTHLNEEFGIVHISCV